MKTVLIEARVPICSPTFRLDAGKRGEAPEALAKALIDSGAATRVLDKAAAIKEIEENTAKEIRNAKDRAKRAAAQKGADKKAIDAALADEIAGLEAAAKIAKAGV